MPGRVSLVCLFACLLVWPLAGALPPVQAQPAGYHRALGGQVGTPSGFTLKLYRDQLPLSHFFPARAVEFLAAWDLDEALFLNIHFLDERAIPDSPLHYFFGPGLVFGVDTRQRRNDLILGVSGSFGVNFFRERFEVYLKLTPRINVLPDTHGSFDAGVGLRYYF